MTTLVDPSLRETTSPLLDEVKKILLETSKENANIPHSPSAKMLQIGSLLSREYYLSEIIPEEFSSLHRKGDIHIHDLDYYGKTLTCLQIPLGDLLEKGFNPGNGHIRTPKRIATASMLASILLQSSQNDMHGGQSFAFFDRDMGPYVKEASDREVFQAMESLIYNLNSMRSRAGAQNPFTNLNLGCDMSEGGRKVTRNLLLAFEKGLGHGETPLFPNVIFRVKEGVNFHKEDPNRDLFELAMRVAAKSMNPTFSFMDASFNRPYGDEVSYMGCRTRVIANRHGPALSEKRGNLSFTSINLPRIALRAKGDEKTFFIFLDQMLELTAKQLYHRFCIQGNLRVKDMPFIMGEGLYRDSERLKWEDRIEEVIKHGTLSIGFIGLAETLIALIGTHHGASLEAQKLGLKIISHMADRVSEFADRYDLNYTFLATPAEGLSGRFIAIDKKRFGLIPHITDTSYYTNSFHVPVHFPISYVEKIEREGPFHKYCNAGHISYVELDAIPEHNIEAVEMILTHMKNADMGYVGINYPLDFCTSCQLRGVFHEEVCPQCGGDDIYRVRRITGYLSPKDHFNPAKRKELEDRVSHK